MENKTTNKTDSIGIHSSRSAPHCPGQALAPGGVWPPRPAAGRAGKLVPREGLSFRFSRAAPFRPGGSLGSLRFSFQILK